MSPNRKEGEKSVMGMTIEEAIKNIKEQMDLYVWQLEDINKVVEPRRYEQCRLAIMSFEMGIKALEQQPCEDCISRQTLDEIKELMTDINGDTVYAVRMSDLRQLPSVTPQPKMGKWINKYAEDACGERYSYWACSECGRDVGFNLANIEDVLSDYPYCHCGAKMVESQESEG